MCPLHPETPAHLPPHPIPLDCPRAPALGVLHHASNSHWSSILHMIKYMFQSYSLKLSHPRLLPLSLKVCSLHLCLFCCPARRIIGTVFLNSMWVKVAQSCLTLCDPMDYTVNGILQARILEWVAFPFCRGSSQPRNQNGVSCIADSLPTKLSGKPFKFHIYALIYSICLSLSDLLHSV